MPLANVVLGSFLALFSCPPWCGHLFHTYLHDGLPTRTWAVDWNLWNHELKQSFLHLKSHCEAKSDEYTPYGWPTFSACSGLHALSCTVELYAFCPYTSALGSVLHPRAIYTRPYHDPWSQSILPRALRQTHFTETKDGSYCRASQKHQLCPQQDHQHVLATLFISHPPSLGPYLQVLGMDHLLQIL